MEDGTIAARESGGTGRRTSLRGWRSQERGGSNPPFRTNISGGVPCTPPSSLHYARAAPARSIPFAIHGGFPCTPPSSLHYARAAPARSIPFAIHRGFSCTRLAHGITLALRQLAPFRSRFMAASPAPRPAHGITLALRQLAPFRSRFVAASPAPPPRAGRNGAWLIPRLPSTNCHR